MTHQDHHHVAQAPGHGGHEHHHPHEVAITLDGHRREIPAGDYVVSALKSRLGVPADYELDEIVNGEFRELADTAHIDIKGGEHFISHVRRGGSS
jgi:hypothetical protein